MGSNREINPGLNTFIESNVTNLQLKNNLEDARSSNIEQIQKVFHVNAEGNPCSNMPEAISDCDMEVDLDSSIFIQNNLPLKNTNAIHFPSCTLYPPHPDEIDKGEINPGSKSVLMACIVKNISEKIMREILGYCGAIECMKVLKNNCVVKFFDVEAADRATYLSNFGIKIENKDDFENNGRIFIYYSSDEIFVNQGKEIRHQEKEFSNLSTTFVPNSEHRDLIDKLKNEEAFIEAAGELIAMLDCGKCHAMTFDYLFQIFKSVRDHAQWLINEKKEAEEELKAAEAKFNTNLEGILLKLTPLIEFLNLIEVSNHCLNSLTATKKKEIMRMNKLALSVIRTHFTEAFKKQNEKELDIRGNQSSSENSVYSSDFQEIVTKEEVEKMKQEIKVYKEKIRISLEKRAAKSKSAEEKERRYLALKAYKSERNKKLAQELEDLTARRREYEESERRIRENEEVKISLEREQSRCQNLECITEFDMHVICLITTYFRLHPRGVSIDRIHYYVTQFIPEVKISKIKKLMHRYPNMFRMESSSTNQIERWYFVNSPFRMPII